VCPLVLPFLGHYSLTWPSSKTDTFGRKSYDSSLSHRMGAQPLTPFDSKAAELSKQACAQLI